jgi:hypothetical protein
MKTGSFIKGAFFAAAASLALSAAPISHAGVLTSSSLTGEGVTINYNGANSGTTAGVFTGTFDADGPGGSAPVNILYWCVDILKHVSFPPFSYDGYTAAAFQSPPLGFSAGRQLDLARLFANNFGTALSDAQHSAAFQLAIWDVLFDNDANLSTYGGAGQFGLSAGNAATIAMAQGYVSNLGGGNPQLLAVQFTSREHQDFITPGTPFLVPEPSPLPLLGAGLAVMLFAMRRRTAIQHRN